MGSDDKGKSVTETIADEAKGLAGEVYKDLGRPVLAPVGKTAGTAVEVLLAPADIIFDGLKAGFGRLKTRLSKKLERVPPERQMPPPPTIAAPAALQYALLGESNEVAELREMFENLLVTSMNRGTAANAHPAFVGMISQMTPDEAWILKSINRIDYAAVHITDVTAGGDMFLGFHTALGLGTGIDETRQQQYISNLDRLGIIRLDWSNAPSNREEVQALEDWANAAFPDRNLSLHGGTISVTPFGRQFLDTCVRPRSP